MADDLKIRVPVELDLSNSLSNLKLNTPTVQAKIQTQLDEISKNLKLNIGQIDASSLNTALSNIQNGISNINNNLNIKPNIELGNVETTASQIVNDLKQVNVEAITVESTIEKLKNRFIELSGENLNDFALEMLKNRLEELAPIIEKDKTLLNDIFNNTDKFYSPSSLNNLVSVLLDIGDSYSTFKSVQDEVNKQFQETIYFSTDNANCVKTLYSQYRILTNQLLKYEGVSKSISQLTKKDIDNILGSVGVSSNSPNNKTVEDFYRFLINNTSEAESKILGLNNGLQQFNALLNTLSNGKEGIISRYITLDLNNFSVYLEPMKEYLKGQEKAISQAQELDNANRQLKQSLISTFGEDAIYKNGQYMVTLDQLKAVVNEAPLAQEYINRIESSFVGVSSSTNQTATEYKKLGQTATSTATNIKSANEQVEQSNQSIVNSEQRVAETLTSTNAQVFSFKQSLQSIGMNDDSINSVINRIEKLDVEVTSLNQSLSTTAGKNGKSILNVEVNGVDKLGQAIKFTQQLDVETGNLIKQIDSVATASTKSASQLDDLMAQQIKRKTELTNQVNQIYNSAIDPNATRSITDSAKLDELNKQYNTINSAIEKMSGTTKTAFAESEAEVTKLISKLKSTVQEYKNAENVSTALKPDKLTSAISKAESEFATLNTKAENANVTSEKLKTNLNEIETILNKPKNGEIINKAEIEQVFTALSKAKSELNALVNAKASNSAVEKVRIQAEALSNELNTFASKNTGFNTFEQTINGTVVSVTSLQNALKVVTSAADLSIIKAQISALKSAFNSSNNDIKKYTDLIDKATTKLNNLQNNSTFLKNSSNPQVVEAKKQITDLITEYQTLKNTLQGDLTPDGIQNAITRFDELDKQFKQVTTSANTLKTSISADNTMSRQSQQAELLSSKIKKLIAEINTYKNANSRVMSSNKLTSNGNTFSQELENMLLQLSHCASTEDFQKIAANFRGIKAEAKQLGIEGGTVFTTLWEKLKKFSSWMSMTSVVSSVVMDIRNAIVELKEVNTLLTEISKANDKLTTSQLAQIGNNSFGVASKYGKTATDYLAGVQEMSRAGYANAEAMGELSTAAQGAGDMTSDTANQFIIAADKAYKMNGSVEELTKTLDGINYITNNNAVNMSELSEGFSIVASTAASFDVTAQELAAALGTMSATTQQSGSEVARAFRAILLNIRQVSDEEENIDAEGLTKYEKACNDLGVSLKEVKDGVLQLRDPMEVLKELSVEYNKLDESDLKRTNLLNSIGGKLRATQLDAILRQWDMYEEMLQQYTDGSGSMANEANKTANSIEGLWNSLKNDWTSFVNEFANSDLFKSLIESARRLIDVLSDASSPLNSILTQFANLLELATKFTDKIGLIPTIFAGLSLKNVGELILKYARSYATTDIKHRECNTF